MKSSDVARSAQAFRVLLIDDNRHGLAVRRSILEHAGYATTIAHGPQAGLDLLAKETFNLVITDYRMPGMNGSEVVRHVRENHPGVPVIIISAFADVLGLDERTTGADCVIAKTATEASHLTRAVARLLKPPRKPVARQKSAGAVAGALKSR
jgi:CheY-like chemotaxis protein